MDFSSIKQKITLFKNKVIELKDKAVDQVTNKIGDSNFVLKNQQEFNDIINKSENKTFTDKDGMEKVFIKRSIVIFAESDKEYYKNLLLSLPIILTKGFSQSINIKVVDIKKEGIDFSFLSIQNFPSLVVFENKEVYKIIYGEENIKKIVKSLNLDINKIIEEI